MRTLEVGNLVSSCVALAIGVHPCGGWNAGPVTLELSRFAHNHSCYTWQASQNRSFGVAKVLILESTKLARCQHMCGCQSAAISDAKAHPKPQRGTNT